MQLRLLNIYRMGVSMLTEAGPKLFRFQFGTRSLSSTKPRAHRTLMCR
jgi:hypothetical protein